MQKSILHIFEGESHNETTENQNFNTCDIVMYHYSSNKHLENHQ